MHVRRGHYIGVAPVPGSLTNVCLVKPSFAGDTALSDPAAALKNTLAGDPIVAKLTRAPGNGASIGGLKVASANGWFAARPSGTENIYKIYAESLTSADHLAKILDEARAIVSAALGTAGK